MTPSAHLLLGRQRMLGFVIFCLIWIAVFVSLAVAGLVTGKTMTPLRGSRPFIVSRVSEPGRFWFGIATYAAFASGGLWFLSVPVLQR